MPNIADIVEPVLRRELAPQAVQSILKTLPANLAVDVATLDMSLSRDLLSHLEAGHRLFGVGKRFPKAQILSALGGPDGFPPSCSHIAIKSDSDVLIAQRHSQLLTRGFFGPTDCVRMATAVSELARNIYMYAKAGDVTLTISEIPTHYRFDILAVDHGPGIANLEHVLSGKYVSRTGMGRGLVGTKALLDELHVSSAVGQGTTVKGHKLTRKA